MITFIEIVFQLIPDKIPPPQVNADPIIYERPILATPAKFVPMRQLRGWRCPPPPKTLFINVEVRLIAL